MGLDTIGDICVVKLAGFVLVITLILSGNGIKADFEYLGCYEDREDDRDLRKSEVTFAADKLTVAECASECQKDGWPYIGLQKGYKCFCGSKYGSFGTKPNTGCNYTCNGNREFCGGVDANSVYYGLDTSAEKKAARSLVHYETAKPYDSARQDCVKNDGDLALIQNTDDIDEVIALFADVELSAQQRKVIFGLFRNPPPDGAFAWADASEILELDTIRDLWKSDEPWQNACTVLDIDTKEFETTSCYAQYPYVCNQAGVDDTGNDYPDEVSGTEEEEEEGGASTMALAIVLPIFAFCYGGSCLLYCVHKLHKNCKRKRRKKLLEEQEHFSEFEPDTKPINPKEKHPPYIHKTNNSLMTQDTTNQHMTQKDRNIAMTVSSAVLITNQQAMKKTAMQYPDGPADESQPEPATSRQTSPTFSNSQSHRNMQRKLSRSSVQSSGPIISSRPTTSEAVHINMNDSPPGTADPNGAPPGYYQSTMFQKKAKQVREEKRRNRLLENALREARQRRAREQSALSHGSISSSKSKESVEQNPPRIVNETPAKPSTPPRPGSMKSARSMKSVKSDRLDNRRQNNREENQAENSGDSMTSLIGDERKADSPDDPTQMSIADIMKVKMMMKARKKRVRKILGT